MTRAERQIRLLLHAWPVADRLERGDEIVGTSLDLVPEGHAWIPLSMAMNLLTGGLIARWRGRPPIWLVGFYRLGGRLPAKWRTWVFHDLTNPGWRRRIVVGNLMTVWSIPLMSTIVVRQLIDHPRVNHVSTFAPPWWVVLIFFIMCVIPLAVIVLVTYRRAPMKRDRLLALHGFHWAARNGPPWPPPASNLFTEGRETHDPHWPSS